MNWINGVALLAIVALTGTVLWAADEKGKLFKFGKDDADKLPAGWKNAQTGKGASVCGPPGKKQRAWPWSYVSVAAGWPAASRFSKDSNAVARA